MTTSTTKKQKRGKLLFQKRSKLLGFAFGACYVGLSLRLFYLQGVMGGAIRKAAEEGRLRNIRKTVERGDIFDRNSVKLAANLYAGELVFDYAAVPAPKSPQYESLKKRLDKSVTFISQVLQLPEPEIRAAIEKSVLRKDRYALIKKPIPWDVAVRFEKPTIIEPGKQKEERVRLLGFTLVDKYQRTYSQGVDAAHVVGMLDGMGAGVMGLELGENMLLQGRQGARVSEVDLFEREIPGTLRKYVEPQIGLNLHTTIDATVQHIISTEASHIQQEYDPKGVSIVVVEPKTGDILGMASSPAFSPNPEERKGLFDDPAVRERTMQERCASFIYEPGSTLKTLTIAAALDCGAITLNTPIWCEGFLPVGKKRINCDPHGGSPKHGDQRPIDVLRHSCNVGAAQIGKRMGGQILKEWEEKFGFFEPLNLPITNERHQRFQRGYYSLDKNENIFADPKVYRVSFGHSITTTPIHVAMAYAAIANGGTLMKPRLVTHATDPDNVTRKEWKSQPVRQLFRPETCAAVQEMMRAVVSAGTAKVAAIQNYQLAGKTGTAKKYVRGERVYVGSFAGFVPTKPGAPPAVVLVVVDEPQRKFYGSEVAAPAFRNIALQLVQYWKSPVVDPKSEQFYAANPLRRKADAEKQEREAKREEKRGAQLAAEAREKEAQNIKPRPALDPKDAEAEEKPKRKRRLRQAQESEERPEEDSPKPRRRVRR